MPELLPEPENWSFETRLIGRRVLVFEKLASTNTTAAELAAGPENNGLAVIAREQTRGRGQYGRVWHGQPGGSLLLSVVLTPPVDLCRPAVLTALAAVSVAEAVHTLTGLQARIKWPNDLLLDGKKVCGILIEKPAAATIVGIGLNLNQGADDFLAANLPEATSLSLSSGASISIRSAAEHVLLNLDRWYARLLSGERSALERSWVEGMSLLGRPVSIEFMDATSVAGSLLEVSFERVTLAGVDGGIQGFGPETVRHIVGL
jgi:BirA family biotin operon repressor/biotin-[acetyl-CoA-carboxylase] ligase